MSTIAFDGVCFGDGPMTGVGRSFWNALAAYAERSSNACVLLLPPDATIATIANVRCVAAPRGALRRQRQLPKLLRSLQADLLHSSVAAVPLRATCPTIATAHDLPWLHPELREPSSAWRRFATRRALRSATRILAPSTMTQRDLETLLSNGKQANGSSKIEVIPHGAGLGPAPTAASTRQRMGPLLVLGDDRPRKNHQRLEAAHRLAQQRCPELPELALVGPPNRYVEEHEKLALLQSCRALVHVSLFEGFGMPVLEGLANGAPVLCSDLAPHHEIAQQHAQYVAATNLEAIAAALVQMHRDEDLRWRLAAGGYQRAQALTPQHTAARWQQLHDELLA